MRELGARWRALDLVFRESSELGASIHPQQLVGSMHRLPATSTCEGIDAVWGGSRSARMSASSKAGTIGLEPSVKFKGRGQRQ